MAAFTEKSSSTSAASAFGKTQKYRELRANPKVAIVIDDPASVTPWMPRGIEVRGKAVLQAEGGGPVPSIR